MWPYIPGAANVRRIMFADESFHRIQPALHLDAPDTPSVHLRGPLFRSPARTPPSPAPPPG